MFCAIITQEFYTRRIMKAVIQLVKKCVLYSDGVKHSEIGHGALVLFGVNKTDTIDMVDKFAEKLLKLRIFNDAEGKTNLNIFDTNGEFMVVSNFTLYGDVKGYNRPCFMMSASHEQAEPIYNALCAKLSEKLPVKTGVFRTNMEIEMIADGPSTYILEF